MFLSTRWGKPIPEIESMPVNQFRRHFLFWKQHKWGMTDDNLAFVGQQMHSHRTKGRTLSISDIKEYVLTNSAKKVFTIQPASVIRKQAGAFLSAMAALSGKKK